MTNTLHIKNELKQLTRLYAFLDQQAGTYELGELQSMQIKLALEEAVTNVIQYAYPDKKDQDIRIDMSYENKRLTIVITDTPKKRSQNRQVFHLLLLLSFLFGTTKRRLFANRPKASSPSSSGLSLNVMAKA